jgi:hypothetical protein
LEGDFYNDAFIYNSYCRKFYPATLFYRDSAVCFGDFDELILDHRDTQRAKNSQNILEGAVVIRQLLLLAQRNLGKNKIENTKTNKQTKKQIQVYLDVIKG